MEADSKLTSGRVVHLSGDFDAPAFSRLRELLRHEPELVLDFHDVHWCQPFALAELQSLASRSGGRVRLRALSRQQEVLLGYLAARD